MTRWVWLTVGLGAYALGLVVMAPATWVDAALRRASAGSVRLAQARGTVWSGSGRIEMLDAERRYGVARNLGWQVLPWSLIRGHLLCEIELDAATRRIPLTMSFSGVAIPEAEITLPAAVLALGVSRLAPLGLTGEVGLRISGLRIERGGAYGNATLQFRSAGSALTRVWPLGDYELQINGTGAVIRASLRTIHGLLQLDGNGSWTHGGGLEFAGSARVSPQYQEQLTPLLRMIAIARGDNTYELKLK